ncbi:MAG: alkylmercury lyase family protein [Opitutae bacterium]|nr:alkylmercury lyase family protein [Opitutae bacterium]
MPTPLNDALVRARLTRFIADRGFAPDNAQLAREFKCETADVENSLKRLHASHGVVLHPEACGCKLWLVHPFALWPGPCFVQTARQSWWSNCIWCSLGIAAMVKEDTTIHVRLGGEAEQVTIRMQGGRLLDQDYLVHLVVPVAQFWDNVVFTCGNMLPFRTETDIDDWCRRHNVARGYVMPLETMWRLASNWYGDWLAPEWRRKTPAEAKATFEQLGLTGPFWSLDPAWK